MLCERSNNGGDCGLREGGREGRKKGGGGGEGGRKKGGMVWRFGPPRICPFICSEATTGKWRNKGHNRKIEEEEDTFYLPLACSLPRLPTFEHKHRGQVHE
jgi:hypothetical protein